MKNLIKFVLNFSFTFLVIKGIVEAVKSVRRYFKARKERLAKEEELRFERIKNDLEEAKKNDEFTNEMKRLVTAADRLTNY